MSGPPRSGLPSALNSAFSNPKTPLSNQLQNIAIVHQNNLLAQQIAAQNMIMPPSVEPRPKWQEPDPKWPDTMGWREWVWHDEQECLVSPSMGTLWMTDRLKAARSEYGIENECEWSEADAVRGVMGIHALLVPRHWQVLPQFGHTAGYGPISGIVERFGKYVLGTEGWRTEHAVIRELLAPNTEIGLLMEQRYPSVIVHYPPEEGESKWKSAESSKLEKGSRMLPPPRLLKNPPRQNQSSPSANPSQLESLLKRLGLRK